MRTDPNHVYDSTSAWNKRFSKVWEVFPEHLIQSTRSEVIPFLVFLRFYANHTCEIGKSNANEHFGFSNCQWIFWFQGIRLFITKLAVQRILIIRGWKRNLIGTLMRTWKPASRITSRILYPFYQSQNLLDWIILILLNFEKGPGWLRKTL